MLILLKYQWTQYLKDKRAPLIRLWKVKLCCLFKALLIPVQCHCIAQNCFNVGTPSSTLPFMRSLYDVYKINIYKKKVVYVLLSVCPFAWVKRQETDEFLLIFIRHLCSWTSSQTRTFYLSAKSNKSSIILIEFGVTMKLVGPIKMCWS
jgi:hypothetical protein